MFSVIMGKSKGGGIVLPDPPLTYPYVVLSGVDILGSTLNLGAIKSDDMTLVGGFSGAGSRHVMDANNIYTASATVANTAIKCYIKSTKQTNGVTYPTPNAAVDSMKLDGNYLYIGGNFTNATFPYFAVIDTTTGAIVSGYPLTGLARVYGIDYDNDFIYLATDGKGILAINKTTKALDTNFPAFFGGTTPTVKGVFSDGNLLYVVSNYSTTASFQGFGVIDKTTRLWLSGYPTMNTTTFATNIGDRVCFDNQYIYIHYGSSIRIINKTAKTYTSTSIGAPTSACVKVDDNYIYASGNSANGYLHIIKKSDKTTQQKPTISGAIYSISLGTL